MKILVLSDSHGNSAVIKKILNDQQDANDIIFCGDGETDIDNIIEQFPEKNFYCARGNCDFGSKKDLVNVIKIDGKKIMYTHGHTYSVKTGLEDLLFAAKMAKVNILLFGHTHNAYSNYEDGIYVVNPGSCNGYGASYAMIDIRENGILPTIVNI